MLVALAAGMLASRFAHAFCGFFVAGSNARLTNSASQVVLMRKGNRTVMTMSNNYQGPPESFAMVIPVPAATSSATTGPGRSPARTPRYDEWGGPNGNGSGGTNPTAARGLATAPRGKIALARELRSPVPCWASRARRPREGNPDRKPR